MSTLAAPDAYGVMTEPMTLKIQRMLPGPIERVWAYLTDSELRRQWLAAGTMQAKAGTAFELVWRNDELSDPPGQRPEGFPEEQRMQCLVQECDPPRKLVITWQNTGDVSFELEQKGDEVLLTLIHRRLPNRTSLLNHSAGWHMHLDLLAARTNDRKTAPFWDGWARLKADYENRIPA